MSDIDAQFGHWHRTAEQASPARIRGLSRVRLLELLGGWGMTKGAEIGVARGVFSRCMFEKIPGLDLIGVDPWLRLGGSEEAVADQALREHFPKWRKLKMRSQDAAPTIPDESLDWVYIDGAHDFDNVMLDLILWGRKVCPGGIVAGHDYYRWRRAGVVPAVDAYTAQHRVDEWYLTDERTPTFFFRKVWWNA